MSKVVFLLTMSANKPDAAFYHQRNCLAGILKHRKEIQTFESRIEKVSPVSKWR